MVQDTQERPMELRYGQHSRQVVDYYSPEPATGTDTPPPLIVYAHGGGWIEGDRKVQAYSKPAHFTKSGYAFASTGYRVLPDAPVEDQARDLAAAIAALRGNSENLGFDGDRIVLMGHSAGGHLAALLGTNEEFLKQDFQAIRAIILLDVGALDVPYALARHDNPASQRIYGRVFGGDPKRHDLLSPLYHVGGADVPAWLVLYVEGRRFTQDQATALAEALKREGTVADLIPIGETNHSRLNRDLGRPDDRATGVVDEFLIKRLQPGG
ncbi:alpha/beta hydrolase [Qipengyuania sp. GH38]|uniref:alpha/beta hydrolase n=1 Tax=Qipengyuania intermedia TaxID=2867244 RepID=UPI001C87DA74|nr:alpha/beta hydrolase [Qipengyuania intermedia]MBX7513385.1 alpha/beta hydrolase [Qipengyuania intermedia]